MKASKEAKRYIALLRKRSAKKNGVIPRYCFDDLRLYKLLEHKPTRCSDKGYKLLI